MTLDPKDVDALLREKYHGNRETEGFAEDMARLASGEPLAYVIGHIPFLGLSIGLTSRPLIPRPETEWWTEKLAAYIGTRTLRVLDVCAGSGAIGLSLLQHCPNVEVSFGEISEMDVHQICENLEQNKLDAARAKVRQSDLFEAFSKERFDLIATNPPYIPEGRTLPESVSNYEPSGALYAGADGLAVIRRIMSEAPRYLSPNGELWMECDIENIEGAATLAKEAGAARTKIHTDQYDRPRLLVAYW